MAPCVINILSVVKGDKCFPIRLFIGRIPYLWLLVIFFIHQFFGGFQCFLISKKYVLIVPCARCLSNHLLYPSPPSWQVVPILVVNNLRLREFKLLVRVTQSEWPSWHLSPSHILVSLTTHLWLICTCVRATLYDKDLNSEHCLLWVFSRLSALKTLTVVLQTLVEMLILSKRW